jgi:hypothetical protein
VGLPEGGPRTRQPNFSGEMLPRPDMNRQACVCLAEEVGKVCVCSCERRRDEVVEHRGDKDGSESLFMSMFNISIKFPDVIGKD